MGESLRGEWLNMGGDPSVPSTSEGKLLPVYVDSMVRGEICTSVRTVLGKIVC